MSFFDKTIDRTKRRLAQSLAGRAWSYVDSKMSASYPEGWAKTKHVLGGWKTIVGLLVFHTPDILYWAEDTLPGVLPAFGVVDAAPYIKLVGSALVAIGMVHKFLKYVEVDPVQDPKNKE